MSGGEPAGSPVVQWAIAAQSYLGETVSGDRHLVEVFPGGAMVAVIDGLGHGFKASAVAEMAIAALEGHGGEPVAALLLRSHRALTGSRGVVMSVASFDAHAGVMTWLGVGNVAGFLLYAEPCDGKARETLLLRGGVVGYHLPSLRPVAVPVSPGDVLVFATDGVRSSFSSSLETGDSPQQIADRVLAEYGRGTDDALVLAARYVGGGE